MRLDNYKKNFLLKKIRSVLPDADIYLFGSRVDVNKKGGDIDILILADRKLTQKEHNSINWDFINKFGEQKLDLVSFSKSDQSSFKNVALLNALPL